MRPIRAILFEPDCLTDADTLYEDVIPALTELKAMGIELGVTGPLAGLSAWLTSVRTFEPDQTMYLTSTAEGISAAKSAGMIPVLMMNDPDEAKRLTAHNPAGGVVSLLELPDFIRFVLATTPLPNPSLSGP
jgi:hypothetical protein